VLAFFELLVTSFAGPPPSSSVPLVLHKSMAFLGLAAFFYPPSIYQKIVSPQLWMQQLPPLHSFYKVIFLVS